MVSAEGLLDGNRREVEIGNRRWWDVGGKLGGLREVRVRLTGTPHSSRGKGEGSKVSGDFEGDKRVELLEAVEFRVEGRRGAKRKKRGTGWGSRGTDSGPTDRTPYDVREGAEREVGGETLL